MDTCVRGFSFMPENKVEVVDLKYVEENDLERTWKATRRERLKLQEEKIWDEFVKEQDIVRSMCKDDPYQFVDQLPQECIKELLDIELQKMKQETVEVVQAEPQVKEDQPDNQHVTFVEESEEDMFHIFDEDKDDVSGPEEEMLNDSLSPPLTVRERDPPSPDKTSTEGKSSPENVTNIIEGSIYCAKVKDLRLRLINELNSIIVFLERVDILNLEPEEATRTLRRASEFSARFGRVHLYQLHRQIMDIERHNDNALPFASRTHFQAQLCRVSSLHNNLLQATQVVLKAVPQTLCVRESGSCVSSLVCLLRRASQAAQRARPPALAAAGTLCADTVLETCDKLVETLKEYTDKMTDYLNSTENTSVSRKSSKISRKKKSTGTWSRSGKSLMSSTDARLSMYSLDTRLTLNKSTSSKDHSSGTSKKHASIIVRTKQTVEKDEIPAKGPKKSPKPRRPLMRAPCSAAARRAPRDLEVRTLVETVPCASSHISREESPLPSKAGSPRRSSRENTPRKLKDIRRSLNSTPRNRILPRSPRLDTHRGRETFRSTTDRPKIVESSRNVDVESVKNIKKSPPKESNDTKDDEVQMKEGDKIVEVDVEKVNTIEKKEMGEEKIKKEKDRHRSPEHQLGPGSCEVTRLLRQLCGGDAVGDPIILLRYSSRSERISGAKNAQLLCVSGGGGSPRPPSTPQLLRILEETIQKKAPKSLFPKPPLSARDKERYRMMFNISERVTDGMFQYRTKFVQHMLTSALYANSAVGKPWEKIGRVSEQIIDELLLNCAKEMELCGFVNELFKSETC